jgi:hypothetical protein
MAREVEVSIGKDGELRVEFSGFAGDECLDEAERLQAVLASLGLEIAVEALQKKSAAQIERELGIEDSGDEMQLERPE